MLADNSREWETGLELLKLMRRERHDYSGELKLMRRERHDYSGELKLMRRKRHDYSCTLGKLVAETAKVISGQTAK